MDELAAIVREAGAAPATDAPRAGFRVRGAGTWLAAGQASSRATPLELGALQGIHEYTPDDLTISVAAATTLAELDAATGPHNQWCPLLPWGEDRSTVGATIATATTGPFATTLGRPRDLVLGLECVDGHGRIIRAGGRVVKNVAGFDLTRLMTGAWGTLGVITAVHLRLRARPTVDETFALRTDDDVAVDQWLRGPLAPLACTPLTPRLANATGAAVDARWLVRLGGNAEFVAASRAALRTLGSCDEMPESVWTTLRAEGAPTEPTRQWRWDGLASRLKRTFDPANLLNPGLLGSAP